MARRRIYVPLRVYLNNRLVGLLTRQTGGGQPFDKSVLTQMTVVEFGVAAHIGDAAMPMIGHLANETQPSYLTV